jgi:SCP-2 sterol transfer family protein
MEADMPGSASASRTTSGREALAITAQSLGPEEIIAVLSKLVSAIGALTQTIGGRVGFFVAEAPRRGWILDLDVPGGDWFEADDDTPSSTRIVATREAFAALLFCPTSIADLIRSGQIEIEGDRTKLAHLGRLIGAGETLLEHRARAKHPGDRRPSRRKKSRR